MEKEVKITPPEGYEIDKGNSTFECIKFKPIEKQGEKKDEEDIDFTIYHPLKNGKGEYECIPYSFYGTLTSFSENSDLINFLRNCFYSEEECEEWIEKQGGQKLAWSEEDEYYRLDVNVAIDGGFAEGYAEELRDWLKSLKERCTWKPSNEQLNALDEVYKTHGANSVCRRIIFNLLEQLKKL